MSENDANPRKLSDMSPDFEELVTKLVAYLEKNGQALENNTETEWYKPEKWNGDPFDYENIAKAFDREILNQMYLECIKDAKSPGTSGDLVSTTTQIDYTSVMQRGFMARTTMSFPRVVALAAGRQKGHGNQKGLFMQNVLQYIRGVLKQAGS